MIKLVKRLMRYFQETPVLEISTNDAFFWENDSRPLKEFARTSLTRLKEAYPQMIIYHPTRTWLTRDAGVADWAFMIGAVQLYEVPFLPNGVDLKELKRTCMDLEVKDGKRIGDIDVYYRSRSRKKLSRKDLVQEAGR